MHPPRWSQIPEETVRAASQTVPKTFYLFDRLGAAQRHLRRQSRAVRSGFVRVHVLDPDTLNRSRPKTPDLVRLIKVAEMLPQYDAQSTAVVCDDVPKEIGDLYRLYVVLMYSVKPVVTGSFSNKTPCRP